MFCVKKMMKILVNNAVLEALTKLYIVGFSTGGAKCRGIGPVL